MKTVRIRVRGEFDDAFIYMGRLLLVGADLSIQSIRLSSILDQVASGRDRRLLRLLFEHNNELRAESLINAAGSAQVANRLLQNLAAEDRTADASPESEIITGIAYSAPLDLLVYYRRLYFATDQGLFSQDVDFDGPTARAAGKPTRRTEAPCLAVTARFGAVNASCEESGLFGAIDEFGWLGRGGANGMSKIADRSRRTSWLTDGFVNYVDNSSITVFDTRAVSVPPKGDEEQERRAIASFDRGHRDLKVLEELATHGIDTDGVAYIWSSLSGVFVQTEQGLYFLRLSADAKDDRPTFVRLGGGFESVLWAGTFGRGTVVETDEAVIAFENHQTEVIQDRPTIAVRTFPNSVWYRRVVATINEDEVILTSVLRDYMLQLED